jgi:hypothetical protein
MAFIMNRVCDLKIRRVIRWHKSGLGSGCEEFVGVINSFHSLFPLFLFFLVFI